MRVALVNFPFERPVVRRYRCEVFTKAYLFPPMPLLYLASVARREHNVFFLDCVAEKVGEGKLLRELSEFEPDVLVFLSGFESLKHEVELAKEIRGKIGCEVGCVGFLPSLFPREVLKRGLDFVILNEPERTFEDMLSGSWRKVKGLAFRKGKKVIVNKRRREGDLKGLPIPSYDLLDVEKYYDIFLPKPFMTVETSRGCPFPCIYCNHPFGRRFRAKPVEKVLEELEFLKKMGVKYVRFLDDTFTLDERWVLELCERMRGLGLKFVCLSRPDTLNERVVKALRRAGCVRVLLGVESGSQRILDYYKRGYKVGDVRRSLKLLKKHGIESIGWFIVGAPMETEEDVEKSIELAELLDWVVVSVLEERPGSEIFDPKNFSLFPYRARVIKEKEGKRWERKFYLRFYSNPRKLLRLLLAFLKYPRQSISAGWNLLSYFLKTPLRPDVF